LGHDGPICDQYFQVFVLGWQHFNNQTQLYCALSQTLNVGHDAAREHVYTHAREPMPGDSDAGSPTYRHDDLSSILLSSNHLLHWTHRVGLCKPILLMCGKNPRSCTIHLLGIRCQSHVRQDNAGDMSLEVFPIYSFRSPVVTGMQVPSLAH
jgi:hypothetical protein